MGLRRFLVGCAIAVAAAAASAGAQAATFSFILVGDYVNAYSYFEVGTVTGYIYGLSENGLGQTPTGALIVTAPANLGLSSTYLPFYPGSGTFDVVNGSITAFRNGVPYNDYGVFFGDPTSYCNQGSCPADIEFLQPSTSGDYVRGSDAGVGNELGAAGVTFSLAGVPEPATWAMMLVGFGALGATLRARRRISMIAAS